MSKKLKIPTLRFKEFFGEWEEKKLEDIAKFSKGKSISKSDIVEDGILECIRYGELYTHYKETINEIYSKTNLDKNDLVVSEYGDIIIPASGETQIDIATASCVLKDGVALSGDLNIIKTDEDGVFLSYYLNNAKKYDIARLSQGISVVHLYSSQLKLLKLNLPQKQEQEKIASFLSSIDKKIEQLSKKDELLESYKKGVMQKIFNQEIRFKADDGSDYSDWEEKKLGDLIKESKEKSTSSGQHEVLSSTKDNIVLQSEYFNREIASKDNTGYKILRIHQLVFSPQNLWLGNINVNTKYEVGIVSPSYKIYDFRDSILVNYGKYFLKTPRMMYEYAQASEQGASVVRRSLNIDLFNLIKISLPCIEEQIKIANFLSSLDTKISQNKKTLEETQKFKKALLQQMFV
jgi:type I restriction enzyme S subunit